MDRWTDREASRRSDGRTCKKAARRGGVPSTRRAPGREGWWWWWLVVVREEHSPIQHTYILADLCTHVP